MCQALEFQQRIFALLEQAKMTQVMGLRLWVRCGRMMWRGGGPLVYGYLLLLEEVMLKLKLGHLKIRERHSR